MSEEEALAQSTGFINYEHIRGYLPFHAANALVASGKWVFKQVTCWGYVVERR